MELSVVLVFLDSSNNHGLDGKVNFDWYESGLDGASKGDASPHWFKQVMEEHTIWEQASLLEESGLLWCF